MTIYLYSFQSVHFHKKNKIKNKNKKNLTHAFFCRETYLFFKDGFSLIVFIVPSMY